MSHMRVVVDWNIIEPLREKTWLQTSSGTNLAIQLQKMARGFKSEIQEEEGLYYFS